MALAVVYGCSSLVGAGATAARWAFDVANQDGSYIVNRAYLGWDKTVGLNGWLRDEVSKD